GRHDRRRHARHAARDRLRRSHRDPAGRPRRRRGRHGPPVRRPRAHPRCRPAAASAQPRLRRPVLPPPARGNRAARRRPGHDGMSDRTHLDPTDAAAAASGPPTAPVVDPYAGPVSHSPVRFLYDLNPLAKISAPLPAMILLVFVRDVRTPLAFIALTAVVLLIGVRFTRGLVALLIGVPAFGAVIALGFALWTDAGLVDDTAPVFQLGGWTLYSGALETGLATGLRIAAIVVLAFIAGLSTTGPDLVRATVQQLRVPYRIG